VTDAPTVRVPPGRLLALGGLGPLSLDLYLPALPTLTTELGADEAAGQLSLSLCMIGLAVGQLLVGSLTDRVGRRIPLLVGNIVFAVSAGLCALVPSIGVLLALRLVSGLAGGAGIAIARAMVRDLYEGPQMARVFSLITLVLGVAPIGAPLLGGLLLTTTSWRGVFVALAVLGIVLLLAATTLGETLPAPRRHGGGLRTTGPALGAGRPHVPAARARGRGVRPAAVRSRRGRATARVARRGHRARDGGDDLRERRRHGDHQVRVRSASRARRRRRWVSCASSCGIASAAA
jgi:MFS family permease